MKRFLVPTLFNSPSSLFGNFNKFYSSSCSCGDSCSCNEERFILADYRTHEEDGVYNIELDLPGVSDKDIDISIKENVLTINATRKRQVKDEKGELVEKSVASYKRSFTLGEKIDIENINAITVDGMLLLSLPISEQRLAVKKIEVNKKLERKPEDK